MLPHKLLYFLVIFYTAECAKILGLFHIPGRSHYMAGSTLMKILAEKGHDVTIVAPFTAKNPPKNFREIILTGNFEALEKQKFDFFNTPKDTLRPPFIFAWMSASMVEMVFNHTNFKKLMNSGEKFDVVIMESFQTEAMKYVAHHFNAPLIAYNAMDANEWVNAYQGNPDSPAHVPNLHQTDFTCKMSFMERVINSLQYVYDNIIRYYLALPMQNRVLHKYYPEAPNLDEFIYNVSLVLLNADPSVHEALPKVPSMVSIGGFHIDKPKPLPEDLQSILDNAKHGVVYFSLGSNVKAKDMPKEKREMIMKALSKLKETVLWKFEADLPGKPENVIIRKWLPQNDILPHKNVKLFITHGGLFSTMETVYHGVPVLCLPIFAEQKMNSNRAAANGFAKVIPFHELTEETLSSYLHELLTDPRFKENAITRSNIMNDKPISPREAVNYWVEYVIRHKGATHLKVASLDLSWYQYILLDVVLFLSTITFLIIWFMKYLIRLILRRNIKKEKTH